MEENQLLSLGMQKIIDDCRSDMQRWITEECRPMIAQCLMKALSIPASDLQISPPSSNMHSPSTFQFHDQTLHQPPPHFSFQPFITTTTQSSTPYYPPMYPQNYYPHTSYPYYQEPLSYSSHTPTYYPEYHHYSEPTSNSNMFTSLDCSFGHFTTPITNEVLLVNESPELECPMDRFKVDNQEGSIEEFISDFHGPTSSSMTALGGRIREAQFLFDEMPPRGLDNCREQIGAEKTELLQEGEDEHDMEELQLNMADPHAPASSTVSSQVVFQFRSPPQFPPSDQYSRIATRQSKPIKNFIEITTILQAHELFDKIPNPAICKQNIFIQVYSSYDPYHHCYPIFSPHLRPPSQPPDTSLVCKSPQTHLLYTILSFIPLQIHRHSENIKAAIVFGNYVFGRALGACQESGPSSLQLGMQIHGLILKTRYALDAVVCNVLISMYGNCSGSAECARRVFDGIELRYSNSWNSMVSVYSQRGDVVSAFDIFSRPNSLRPNEYTFGSSVTAACSLIDIGLSLLEQMLTKVEKSGFLKDLFVGSALVSGFSKFGSIGYAKKILEEMSVRNAVSMNGLMVGLVRQKRGDEASEVFMEMKDLVGVNLDSYAILLSALAEFVVLEDGRRKGKEVHAYLVRTHLSDIKVAYAKCGAIHEACSVFRLMVDKDSVSWNSLISGLDQNECFEDAIISFRTVRRTRLMPTNFTLISTLSSCGSSGLSILGVQIHCEGVKLGLDLDVSVSNALLVVYAGTGCFNECQMVFLLTSEYDQVSWNSVIGALADSDKSVSEAVGYFLGMMRAGWSFNRITFINILTAVSSLSPLELGHQIHTLVLKHCVDNDIAIENALLSFYVPAHGILDGWVPVDFGPNSLDEISSLLSKCKKIIWIGLVKFKVPNYNASGTSTLVLTLDKLGQSNCDITVVGTAACKAIMRRSCPPSAYNMIENATAFWDFIKGRKLPGLLLHQVQGADILEALMQLTQAPSWSWWIIMKASFFKGSQEKVQPC